MLISEHLSKYDLDNAARIATERVRAAEDAVGKDHMAVAAFLNFLGSIQIRQGRCEAAVPVYERSLRIFTSWGVADTASEVYSGLAECFLVARRGGEADALLHPVVHKMRCESRLGLHESIANSHAVVLREIGNIADAEELESFIDNNSHSRPGVNAQERDFLHARLLAARGEHAQAETIYRKWIEHWERWGESVKDRRDEREWDRILMVPLQRYADFLVSLNRKDDASTIRQRLQALLTKYRTKGSLY